MLQIVFQKHHICHPKLGWSQVMDYLAIGMTRCFWIYTPFIDVILGW